MGRRHRNEHCGRFELFSAPTSLGSSFVRKITAREGDGLVAQGKAKLLYDDGTESWWYRLTGETRSQRLRGKKTRSLPVLF